jgi:LuxR family maltose regulon positive regulatory protein
MISAPAGFGKTTLSSEWLNSLGSDPSSTKQKINRIAWLSLDEGDNDVTGFLTYFIAALNRAEGTESNFGEGALALLQSLQPPPVGDVLTSLINEIAAIPDRRILVIDDYHLIEDQAVHDALTFLLKNMPPQMHLVIITRVDPQLPLARLRARNQLTELRASDLRFTSSESAEFLNQVMGLDLSTEDIAALESRIEGWITGLQLAAISMRGNKDTTSFIKSFTGSHHYVLEYLIEEVLIQLSEDIQTFLQLTAILNRLNGPLCDALTGQDNGQATLEMLNTANLFIVPLDDERYWYRYHHLFTDLLRQRLHQTQSDLVHELHSRASKWYEQNHLNDEAVDHALAAGDFERVVYLIEEQAEAIWERGEHAKFWRWLDGLPADLVFSKPQLCILHAESLIAYGQMDEAEQNLQVAEQALSPGTDQTSQTSPVEQDRPPGANRMKLRGRVAANRALVARVRGDLEGTLRYARQALEHLPEHDLTWRSTVAIILGHAHSIIGDMPAAYQAQLEALEATKASGDTFLFLTANVNLMVTLRQQGRLQQILEICQQQLQLANEAEMSQSIVVGWLLTIWGEVLAELNDLDGALDKARMGVELAENSENRIVGMLSESYLCLIRVLFSRKDMVGAEEIIHKLESIVRESDVPFGIPNLMAAWQAQIWLALDKLEVASHWAEDRELEPDGDLTYLREREYVVLARILLAQERLDEAIGLLHRLLEAGEAGGRTSRTIEIIMLQALAYQAGGDMERAMSTFERCLHLAEPGGFVRIFIDEGSPMVRLVQETFKRGIAPEYVHRLLVAFSTDEQTQAETTTSQVDQSKLIEPLSERELEVLQRIAEGLTNREIGDKLYLSLNTVKVHTRNIYGKLGVNNRTQAAARAKDLGILPSN